MLKNIFLKLNNKVNTILEKFLNYSFIVFNVYILIIDLILLILNYFFGTYGYNSLVSNLKYTDESFWTCLYLSLNEESIVVISLIVFGFFNVLWFNKLNKKIISYIIATIIPFLIIWRVTSSLDAEGIYTYIAMFLLMAFSAIYILDRKFNFLLKLLLILISSLIIYFIGAFLGIILGFINFGF